MTNQPFVDLISCGEAELRKLLDVATAIKAQPKDFANSLQGKLLYGLYQKTSTRTHVSFSRAAAIVGCDYISQTWEESNFSISDIAFEAQYIGTVADFFMARLKNHDEVLRLASAAGIPLINGCCNKFHPMQALADSFSMLEYFGALGGQRFLYIGVANNMLNSLAVMLTTLGVKVIAFTPEVNSASQDDRVEQLLSSSPLVDRIDDMTESRLKLEIEKADVVYVDTWVDMENYLAPEKADENRRRTELLRHFSLTPEAYGQSQAVIMHCMPIHPGYEISREMVNHPNSIIFDQAKNRTYVQASTLLSADVLPRKPRQPRDGEELRAVA